MRALPLPLLRVEMLTQKGNQTVAEIVAELQAANVPQGAIDRWLQGLGRHYAE